MRVTIGAKIFGIAVGLLLLMGAVAWVSTRLTQTVDEQLAVLDQDYFPGYIEFAHANIHTVEESALIRRVLLAFDQGETATGAKVPALLVVGRKEAAEHSVSIRRLGKEGQRVLPLDAAIGALAAEAIPPDELKEKKAA